MTIPDPLQVRGRPPPKYRDVPKIVLQFGYKYLLIFSHFLKKSISLSNFSQLRNITVFMHSFLRSLFQLCTNISSKRSFFANIPNFRRSPPQTPAPYSALTGGEPPGLRPNARTRPAARYPPVSVKQIRFSYAALQNGTSRSGGWRPGPERLLRPSRFRLRHTRASGGFRLDFVHHFPGRFQNFRPEIVRKF